ncbi:helix-turn-helix domain-containing protein [Streptomyces sp. NPDC015127]|uniref:helix-turn-helix domain-containing protein n=1 Tax=Streptomyces sp. NPDC015127 TaxID=3364939 RepID=UPI0037019252
MTTPEQQPPVNRRQFGAELRRLRKAAGLQQEDVAAHLGTSTTRVSRMETGKGRVVAKPEEVRRLCELFRVTDERQVQRLVEMVATSRQPGWWDQYRDVLPSGLEVLVSMETAAHSVRAWEPKLVPGLLQTESYARAVIQTSPTMRPHDVDDMVKIRTERQKAVTDPQTATRPPLELWAILDEDVITRPVGGAEAMREQIAHLLAMGEQPHVTLQVVPRAKGANPGLGGAFSLLDFETGEPAVVYVDSPAGNLYLEKRADVRAFATAFDLLRAAALDPDESAALMRRASKEMQDDQPG